jgi:hypothetical protein
VSSIIVTFAREERLLEPAEPAPVGVAAGDQDPPFVLDPLHERVDVEPAEAFFFRSCRDVLEIDQDR